MTIVQTNYEIGDVLTFKKQHPCGGNDWKVLKTGVNLKLECTTCKHIIILPRVDIIKKLKNKGNIK